MCDLVARSVVADNAGAVGVDGVARGELSEEVAVGKREVGRSRGCVQLDLDDAARRVDRALDQVLVRAVREDRGKADAERVRR